MLGLVLQGENLESGLCWSGPVTATFKRRFLPEGVAVEETFSLRLFCQEMVGADMVVDVVYQPLF